MISYFGKIQTYGSIKIDRQGCKRRDQRRFIDMEANDAINKIFRECERSKLGKIETRAKIKASNPFPKFDKDAVINGNWRIWDKEVQKRLEQAGLIQPRRYYYQSLRSGHFD